MTTTTRQFAEKTAAVTNVEVGIEIDMGYTGVSRLRSGDRNPSIPAMLRIQEAYEWPIADQIKARQSNRFHEVFEEKLIERYGSIYAPKRK